MPSRKDEEAADELHGSVHSVAGPVVIAENLLGCSMFELVRVGHDRLVGEVIRIDADRATIQVYEDTSGMSVGEPVHRTGKPMSAELGPGLLQTMFDGIQRPLKEVSERTGSIYIPRGIDIPALNREKKWDFVPGDMKVGDHITGGDSFGTVFENSLLPDHKILLPPRKMGTITQIAEKGSYTVGETILEVEFDGQTSEYSMFHNWPIRVPRPVKERLTSHQPLIIGQRVLDALYPITQGGTVCIPGAFGCGKTVISHSLSKFSNSDIIVYVGCGERGNELAEVLQEFPELHVDINGRQEPIMKRTVLIGNTSNMPVAAREASVYTGITVSEYFRDQGKNAAMIADSTSRWAEALREISGRLEEMPGESGFPPYLGAKLASFYERAGLATARGLPVRRGSVSIVGAVSPAGGDFSEPVTQSTLNIVQAFWGLDKALAQRKHFPSVNVHASWTKYTDPLREYYQEHRPEFPGLRDRIKALLASFKEVEEAISLVGPDGLTGQDRVVYFLGKLVMDDFLQQNGFSPYDQFCPLWKTEWIMKAMMAYYDELQMAVSRGMSVPKIIGATNDIRTRVQSMKFELPSDGEEAVTKKYEKIMEDMSSKFASLDIE